MDFSTSLSEASDNVFFFVFISLFYVYFFEVVRGKIKILTDLNLIKRIYHMKVL